MREEEKEKSDEGSLETALKVIPSVYYDLIARICPGIAFCLALVYDPKATTSSTAVPDPISNAVILIVLSYLAGIMLTGFSFIWDAVCMAVFVFPWFRDRMDLLDTKCVTAQWEHVAARMEMIWSKNPEAGHTVAKMLAEAALCENLLSGFLLLMVIGRMSGYRLFKLGQDGPWFVLLSVIFLFFVTMVFRQGMFLLRVRVIHQAMHR